MADSVSLFIILLAIYIPSIKCENKETQTSKEWIFQFDLENAKHWDNYQVTKDDSESSKLIGSSDGCTSRIPIIFKKLCINWNHNNGYVLQFKSSNNMNIDPNYDDMLWYYGDHNTAKQAEQIAKAKYLDLEDRQLTEISHQNIPSSNLPRRLSKKLGSKSKKCYWYNDAQACAHLDESNPNLMTVSVGLDENNAAAQYSDYDDYYNEEDYNYYDDDNDDEDVQYEYEYYDDNDDENDEEYYDNDDDEDQQYYDDDEDYIDEDDDDYYEDEYYDNADAYAGDEYYNEYDLNEIYNEVYNEYVKERYLYNQYMQQANNLLWQQQQEQQLAAMKEYYNNYYNEYENEYGYDSDEKETSNDNNNDGAQFGISQSNIMEKAEAEARVNVEKKMEKKLEGRLEAEMMRKLNGGFDGMMHPKHKTQNYGGDMDDEHGEPPDEREDMEIEDQNEQEPHGSLSAE